MAERRGHIVNSPQPKRLLLGGKFTVGAAGAVSSEDGTKIAGGAVTVVGATDGRWLVTLYKTFTRVRAGATIVGPDSAALTISTGTMAIIRDQNTANFLIQVVRTDTGADADPTNPTEINWWAFCDE